MKLGKCAHPQFVLLRIYALPSDKVKFALLVAWVSGDNGGGAAEVAGAAGRLALLPVAVEGEGGVREHGVGVVARAGGLDGAALGAGAARVVHGLLDDGVRHRGLGHAPERLPGPRRQRRRQRRRVHDRRLERPPAAAAAGAGPEFGRAGHHDDGARRHRSERRASWATRPHPAPAAAGSASRMPVDPPGLDRPAHLGLGPDLLHPAGRCSPAGSARRTAAPARERPAAAAGTGPGTKG